MQRCCWPETPPAPATRPAINLRDLFTSDFSHLPSALSEWGAQLGLLWFGILILSVWINQSGCWDGALWAIFSAVLQKQNASLSCSPASTLESGSSMRAMKPLGSHKYPSAEAFCAFLDPIWGVKWGNLQCDVCLRTDVNKSNKTPRFYSKSALMLFSATFKHRDQADFLVRVIHRQRSEQDWSFIYSKCKKVWQL